MRQPQIILLLRKKLQIHQQTMLLVYFKQKLQINLQLLIHLVLLDLKLLMHLQIMNLLLQHFLVQKHCLCFRLVHLNLNQKQMLQLLKYLLNQKYHQILQ